jgi:hypothetical protein
MAKGGVCKNKKGALIERERNGFIKKEKNVRFSFKRESNT